MVDLFVKAKKYTEEKMGRRLEARAHATWAESPTIDSWGAGESNHWRPKYEYTPDFVWSNTVQQAAAACDDYFKWGDFLTGNGNDHAEGGWIDRDYFALALAASTGIVNEVPYSYAAHWGHPVPIMRRRTALVNVFGAGAEPGFAAVEGSVHRDTEVLMLYPLDLVAVEERFGSWMVQYGYANYITPAKLVELGKVNGNSIEMAGRRFTTLVALFEPFPRRGLLEMMRELVRNGGRVVWSGPPPMFTFEGGPRTRNLAGDFRSFRSPGRHGRNADARDHGAIRRQLRQRPAADDPLGPLVDRIYPVQPGPGTETVARVKGHVAGTRRGSATYLGYRPRDDQSRSLGYDVRNWFEVLDALNAYPGADNPDRISRLGDYLACRFPNGSIALAPHLREIEEGWQGGFSRDRQADQLYLEQHSLPSERLRLRDVKVGGHRVDFDGEHAVVFRLDATGNLIAFAGRKCREITVDGRKTVFAGNPLDSIAWAPVAAERRVNNGAVIQILVSGSRDGPHPRGGTGPVRRRDKAGQPGSPRPASRGERSPGLRSHACPGRQVDLRSPLSGGAIAHGIIRRREIRRAKHRLHRGHHLRLDAATSRRSPGSAARSYEPSGRPAESDRGHVRQTRRVPGAAGRMSQKAHTESLTVPGPMVPVHWASSGIRMPRSYKSRFTRETALRCRNSAPDRGFGPHRDPGASPWRRSFFPLAGRPGSGVRHVLRTHGALRVVEPVRQRRRIVVEERVLPVGLDERQRILHHGERREGAHTIDPAYARVEVGRLKKRPTMPNAGGTACATKGSQYLTSRRRAGL